MMQVGQTYNKLENFLLAVQASQVQTEGGETKADVADAPAGE